LTDSPERTIAVQPKVSVQYLSKNFIRFVLGSL